MTQAIDRTPMPKSVRFDNAFRILTQRLAFAGVMGMLAISILTTLDVLVFRYLLNTPISGSNEFLSTVFAVAIAAVLPSGLAQRGMLEVDIFAERMGQRRAAWLRTIAAAFLLVFLVIVAWRVVDYAVDAYKTGRQTVILQWKTWPFLSAIAAIFVLCVPVQLACLVEQIYRLTSAPTGTDDGLTSNTGAFGRVLVVVSIGVLTALAVGYWGVGHFSAFISGHGALLAAALFLVLWALIMALVPVVLALFVCGFLGIALLKGFPVALTIVGSETTALITNVDLAVLPLFLIMGGLASANGMASDVYRLASAIFGFQRGGLALATIGGSAGFGALTGSSLATVATIGRAAYPEMIARGYSKSLATGCIAAGGCLGQIVPPSTAAVLYAILVEQSIGTLYIAMLIPAVISILFYLAATWLIITLRPDSAPGRSQFDLAEFLAALRASASSFLMFGAVIGGIFGGIFTATEAAAVGVLIAFLVAVWRGKLKGEALSGLIVETTQATAMLYFVLIGANVFSFFMGAAGLPGLLTRMMVESGLGPLAIITLLLLVYLVLGMVMDAFTILLVTAPIVAGVIVALGYDLIWWGVIMVVVIEIGVISPPFGMNLFVMKGVAPDVPLTTIFRGVWPFVAVDVVKLAILVLFPVLSLWLPSIALR